MAQTSGMIDRIGAMQDFKLYRELHWEGTFEEYLSAVIPLMKYAKATGAEEVITHHGFAAELAASLRKEGIFARPVGKALQMEMQFDRR